MNPTISIDFYLTNNLTNVLYIALNGSHYTYEKWMEESISINL